MGGVRLSDGSKRGAIEAQDRGQVGKGAEKAGSLPRAVRERQGYGLSRDNERPHKADRNARQTNPSVVH